MTIGLGYDRGCVYLQRQELKGIRKGDRGLLQSGTKVIVRGLLRRPTGQEVGPIDYAQQIRTRYYFL